MEKPKLQQPCLWYLNIAILLGATAYPSVVWLPGFIEKYRTFTGLHMFQFLLARDLGHLLALLTVAVLACFILSAFYSELKNVLALKIVSTIVIGVYAIFVLDLYVCLLVH